MLDNFQLAVVCKSGKQMRLLRVPLHHDLQATLAAGWAQQLADFAEDTQEVPFDAGYTPEAHERFCLTDYVLPAWLKDESSLTIPNLESINAHEELMPAIQCVAGFARDEEGEELVLFQNFSRSPCDPAGLVAVPSARRLCHLGQAGPQAGWQAGRRLLAGPAETAVPQLPHHQQLPAPGGFFRGGQRAGNQGHPQPPATGGGEPRGPGD